MSSEIYEEEILYETFRDLFTNNHVTLPDLKDFVEEQMQFYQPCDCPAGERISSSASGNSSDPGPSKKRRNYRTSFTKEQRKILEKKFQESKYLTRVQRCELAEKIGVTETAIRGWFQNQRTKIGKNANKSPETSSVSSGSSDWAPRTPTPAQHQPVPDPLPPQTHLLTQTREYPDCLNYPHSQADPSHFSHSRQVNPSHYYLPPYPTPPMPYPPPYPPPYNFGHYGYNYGHYGYHP
ncbi:homeobox protein LOX10-like [Phlebotomus papatasi]|uniref:homeobox protein LOX10-like n=1 Tax=Phlebotomus papatasi TaxID=29031 RepID=UPI00248358A6|nr:homeobox protein LOX10-like [Phlebotomus papatasi]